MNATIIDYAKAKQRIIEANERAGKAVWEYGLRMLKNGVKPRELSK
jgi:hypothetical protein